MKDASEVCVCSNISGGRWVCKKPLYCRTKEANPAECPSVRCPQVLALLSGCRCTQGTAPPAFWGLNSQWWEWEPEEGLWHHSPANSRFSMKACIAVTRINTTLLKDGCDLARSEVHDSLGWDLVWCLCKLPKLVSLISCKPSHQCSWPFPF